MWRVYALFAALFAALTSVLARLGMPKSLDSTLATAVRTVVVLALSWGMVLATGTIRQLPDISKKSWIFLILSGLATGASWLFYFKAVQQGPVSKVAVIDKFSVVLTMLFAALCLGETLGWKTVVGCFLVTAGTVVLIL